MSLLPCCTASWLSLATFAACSTWRQRWQPSSPTHTPLLSICFHLVCSIFTSFILFPCSLCVCVYPPPPPSSFSLADCRCVNTCWKEVWQWARRWMQSRLVNNALWHSSVGECSVFCSALTPHPPPKKMFCSYPTHWTLIMFSPWPLCSQPDTSPSSSSCTDLLLLLLPVCSHFDSCVQCSRRERLKPVSADSSLSC